MNLYCPNYHIIPFPYIFPCLLYLQWFGIFWRIWSCLDYTDSFPYSNFSCQKSSVSLVFLLSTWLSGQRKKKRMIIQASIHTHKFFLLMSVISVQFSPQLCPTIYEPMDCSTPGFLVHHQLLELAQTPSSRWCHPTISPSIIPFSSCLQSFPASGFFQGVSSLHQVAKVLEFQLQHQSFQWIFRTDFL